MAYGEYIPQNHGTIIEADKAEVEMAYFYVSGKLNEAREEGDLESERNYLAERQRFQHGLGRNGLTALKVESPAGSEV
jgi:hypothetical protein